MVPHRSNSPRWGELLLRGEISASLSEKCHIADALGYSVDDMCQIGIEILRGNPYSTEYDFFLHAARKGIESRGREAIIECSNHLGVPPGYLKKILKDRGYIISIKFQVALANFLGCTWHDMISEGQSELLQ